MAARILEVHATAAEVMVDRALLALPGIGPVLEAALLDPAEDLIELLLAHQESVMLHLDFHAIGAQESKRHLVRRHHVEERPERRGRRPAEHLGVKPRGGGRIERMDGAVVELGGHGGGSVSCKDRTMLQNSPMYAYIPAKDVSRARKFYEDKIGLKPKEEIAGGVVYEFGKGTACFLYPTENTGTSKASQAFWQVEDIEREVAELKKRGVKFEEYDMPDMKTKNSIFTGGGAKAAWFKDSEGNILAVIQDYR